MHPAQNVDGILVTADRDIEVPLFAAGGEGFNEIILEIGCVDSRGRRPAAEFICRDNDNTHLFCHSDGHGSMFCVPFRCKPAGYPGKAHPQFCIRLCPL